MFKFADVLNEKQKQINNAVKHTESTIYEWNTQHATYPLTGNEADECTTKNFVRSDEILKSLLYVLEHKKVYLDPHVSLYGLSLLLCTNTTYLSRVVNQHFGCNLRTVLNKYRVEYAKDLLKSRKCSIKDLPPLCGFISRSTFYAVFSKFEHITPVEYRQQFQEISMA